MKELKEKISDLINSYFDKKIENVDWHYDLTAEEKANWLISECINDVLSELDGYDQDIDEHIEELEEMYAPEEHPTDYELDCYYRTRDLIDERR